MFYWSHWEVWPFFGLEKGSKTGQNCIFQKFQKWYQSIEEIKLSIFSKDSCKSNNAPAKSYKFLKNVNLAILGIFRSENEQICKWAGKPYINRLLQPWKNLRPNLAEIEDWVENPSC